MVTRLGGTAQKRQLVALGATDYDLTVAVRQPRVLRVRNGWYTTDFSEPHRVRAVRVGGRLTGLSAIADAGGWVANAPPLHVAVRPNAARLRSPTHRRRRLAQQHGVRLHWDDGTGGTATRVAIPDALVRVILDEPLEDAVAAVDWAFHAGEIDPFTWEEILLRLPLALRGIRDWVDPECDSFPESIARTRFRMLGLTVRSQVPITDASAIDLVIEDVIGLEVDGEKYHRDRFHSDRLKDLQISLEAMHAMRPSASIVFGRWAELARAVLLALAARGRSPGAVPVVPRRGARVRPRPRPRPRRGNSG